MTEDKDGELEGFHSIRDLTGHYDLIPEVPGVYLVLWPSQKEPTLIDPGTGGHFKGKDPNVDIKILEASWVNGTNVLYIGMASKSLRARLRAFVRFGEGKSAAHWGGRYIWQIRESRELKVCWLRLGEGHITPRSLEAHMIADFKRLHGKQPFANLHD